MGCHGRLFLISNFMFFFAALNDTELEHFIKVAKKKSKRGRKKKDPALNKNEKKRDLSDESQLNTTNTLKKFKSSLPNRTSMASSTSLAASLSDGELTKKPKYNKKKPLTKPVDEPKKKRS